MGAEEQPPARTDHARTRCHRVRSSEPGTAASAGAIGCRFKTISERATRMSSAIHVSGLSATVIYTDTHRSRAAFLQRVLEPYQTPRKTKPRAPGARYELRAGRYTSQKPSDLEQYLKFFGSRLVFLVDRNCAREDDSNAPSSGRTPSCCSSGRPTTTSGSARFFRRATST